MKKILFLSLLICSDLIVFPVSALEYVTLASAENEEFSFPVEILAHSKTLLDAKEDLDEQNAKLKERGMEVQNKINLNQSSEGLIFARTLLEILHEKENLEKKESQLISLFNSIKTPEEAKSILGTLSFLDISEENKILALIMEQAEITRMEAILQEKGITADRALIKKAAPLKHPLSLYHLPLPLQDFIGKLVAPQETNQEFVTRLKNSGNSELEKISFQSNVFGCVIERAKDLGALATYNVTIVSRQSNDEIDTFSVVAPAAMRLKGALFNKQNSHLGLYFCTDAKNGAFHAIKMMPLVNKLKNVQNNTVGSQEDCKTILETDTELVKFLKSTSPKGTIEYFMIPDKEKSQDQIDQEHLESIETTLKNRFENFKKRDSKFQKTFQKAAAFEKNKKFNYPGMFPFPSINPAVHSTELAVQSFDNDNIDQ